MDTLAFIARYEAILKEKNIPKMTLYKDCGLSDAAVSQWRKGKTTPSIKSVDRIAQYLGVPAEYLLTGSEKEKMPTKEGEHLSSGLSNIYFSLAKDLQDAKIDPDDVRNFAKIIAKNMKKNEEHHD